MSLETGDVMADEGLVHGRLAMLAGMTPILSDGVYHFCTTRDERLAEHLVGVALAAFREDEGFAFVLADSDALEHRFNRSLPMSRIVLQVFSALDGVGLTAGVATALADEGVPCNMIAAFHHDNVFVPVSDGNRALAILKRVQREAAATLPS
jgi:uncharacterized protein